MRPALILPNGTALGPAVVFDIDGTLLDSAAGIVAGFDHALRAVGVTPPPTSVLRSNLGPPIEELLLGFGVPLADVTAGGDAYRRFYRAEGIPQSRPYPGVVALLDELGRRGVVMGTATAKRTDIARAIVEHHGLGGHFAVVNGTDDVRVTKSATLGYTLELLSRIGSADLLMVGDRSYDIAGAHACGVTAVGVTWGYGTVAELRTAGADHLIDEPAQLLDLLDT